MRNSLLALLLLSLAPLQGAQAADSLDELLGEVKQQRRQELAVNAEREQRFLQARERQLSLLDEARAQFEQLQAERDRLNRAFDANEQQLTQREERLRQKTGNLGELFGVVKQTAGDLRALLDDSLISAQYPDRAARLLGFADSNRLPSVAELEQLWFALQQEMTETGRVARFEAEIVARDGTHRQAGVTRIGPFTAVADGQFLSYSPETGRLAVLARQPDGSALAAEFEQGGQGFKPMWVDPTRGTLLTLLTQKPTLAERLQQAGVVGYIIIALGGIGLVLVAARLVWLLRVRRKVARQLAQPEQPRLDNPLGRILSVYDRERELDVESLELQLDEAVLKETPALERGQSIVKLLAGVAPLLGLLGTVTGMIATFQAITLFGSGDPKLMAGGISQALITTVLGLVVAIPLLFGHSLLVSRSRALNQLLDEKSAALLARCIEAMPARAGAAGTATAG